MGMGMTRKLKAGFCSKMAVRIAWPLCQNCVVVGAGFARLVHVCCCCCAAFPCLFLGFFLLLGVSAVVQTRTTLLTAAELYYYRAVLGRLAVIVA
jgi:hypothetical protein